MLAVSDSYNFLRTWGGRLVVETVTEAAGGPYEIGPSDSAQFCDHGLAVSWGGDEPSGVFLPWSSIAVIRQVPREAHAALSAA